MRWVQLSPCGLGCKVQHPEQLITHAASPVSLGAGWGNNRTGSAANFILQVVKRLGSVERGHVETFPGFL